jgi:hypothetical protein
VAEQEGVLELRVSLGAGLRSVRMQLQRICLLVRAALLRNRGAEPSDPLVFDPDAPLEGVPEVFPALELVLTGAQLQEEFAGWIVANGTRDLIESVGQYLERLRSVTAAWKLAGMSRETGSVSGEEWNRLMNDEARAFHKRGLPDKLTFLEQRYGIALDPGSTAAVCSINRLRNCLVHRNGIVDLPDLGEDNALEATWARLVLVVHDSTGEKETPLPVTIPAGGKATLRSVPVVRKFTFGERIVLTADDFSAITWTLLTFINNSTLAVQEEGVRLGFVLPPGTAVLAPGPVRITLD